jgi:hypothetical protein
MASRRMLLLLLLLAYMHSAAGGRSTTQCRGVLRFFKSRFSGIQTNQSSTNLKPL